MNPYFCVYSPRTHSQRVREILTTEFKECSMYFLWTEEYGSNKQHLHDNFLYYSSARDAYNETTRVRRFLAKETKENWTDKEHIKQIK